MTDAQPIGCGAAATSPDPPARDLLPFWRTALGVSNWLGEDVFTALYESFVGRVEIPEETLNVIRTRPVIYIANHQVAVESLLFILAMSGIAKSHVRALAKQAHRQSWVGELMGLLYTYPEAVAPPLSFYRDEYDPRSLVDLIAEMKSCLTDQGHSLLIHAEGARVLHCRRPISQLSMVFIDLARESGAAIVPVSFAGGLPVEAMDNYRDFPIGFGAQGYCLGNPIEADWLASLHPRDRRQVVVDAINGIGPAFHSAVPSAANTAFLRGVQDFLHETATTQVKAVLVTALRALADPTHQTRRLLAAIAGEGLTLDATPEDRWLGDFCAWISDGRARIVRPAAAQAAGTGP